MGKRINTQSDALIDLQRGARVGLAKDVFVGALYDTKTLSSVLVHRYFQEPVGVNGKTEADTNLRSSGSVPQGKRFTVHAIKVLWCPHNVKTAANLVNIHQWCFDSSLRIKINGKEEFGQWTLAEMLGFNFPIVGEMGATPELGWFGWISLNRDNVKDAFPLNIPVVLPAQQNFEFILESTYPVAEPNIGDRIKISCAGQMENAQ